MIFRRLPERLWKNSNRASSFLHQKVIIRIMSPSRILGEEMNELKDLADKPLARQILDHEAYRSKIQKIFQDVEKAMTTFLVRTIMFI